MKYRELKSFRKKKATCHFSGSKIANGEIIMYNKVFLIGNLTKDPELRCTPSGIPVVRFTLAVNRPTAKSEKNEVDFINIVAWRRLAEICGEYLKKGRPVSIEGRLQIRTYEKDGEKRIFAEVVADGMQMLGKKEGAMPQPDKTVNEQPSGPAAPEGGEEIPF
jgi:single-strand DNA-binding protein